MTDFLLILKLLIKLRFRDVKNFFRRGKDEKNISVGTIFLIIFLTILVISFIVLFCFAAVVESSAAINEGLFSEYLIWTFLRIGIAITVFGIINIITYLFFNNDIVFYLHLPIKSKSIFFAKFIALYLSCMTIPIVFGLPIGIAIGIANHSSYVFYICYFIAIIFSPLLPIVISAILSIPIMFVVNFLKKRSYIIIVVALVVICLAYFAYYYFTNVISNSIKDNSSTSFLQSFSILLNSFLPYSTLARLASKTSNIIFSTVDNYPFAILLNIGLFLSSVVILLIIFYLCGIFIFRRGVKQNLEYSQKSNAEYKHKTINKERKPITALAIKEWKEIVRYPAVAIRVFLIFILPSVMVVVLSWQLEPVLSRINLETSNFQIVLFEFLSIAVLFFFVFLMSVGSASSVSREKDNAYLMKILPIDAYTQIKAKVIVYTIIDIVASILSLVFFMIFTKQYYTSVLAIVFFVLYSFGHSNYLVKRDFKKPKLDWKTPNELFKRSMNIQLSLLYHFFVEIVFAIIIGIVFIILVKFDVSRIVFELVSWGVLYLLTIGYWMLERFLLKKGSTNFLRNMQI